MQLHNLSGLEAFHSSENGVDANISARKKKHKRLLFKNTSFNTGQCLTIGK